MLTLENGIYLFTAAMILSFIGWSWGVMERTTEITLDEVFKE